MSKSQKKTKTDLGQVRNTVESIYIAIVLAFVLRAFIVQAFVIPTGSMANSLYGEHFELECPSCHYNYPYGATQPVPRNKPVIPSNARCPNCGYLYSDAMQKTKSVSVRGGDKVLVMKYLYDFSPPKRWDVVVFKNPQNNRENYIKRLIGLPGETLQVIQGDVFVSSDGGETYRIARKPREAQEAMWYVVYDNDYIPNPEMMQAPPHWNNANDGGQWDCRTKTENGVEISRRVFRFKGSDTTSSLEFNPGSDGFAPICSYNSNIAPPDQYDPDSHNDICTDWMLSCVLTPDEQAESQLAMTFQIYEDRFRAEFNTGGMVRLMHQSRTADPNDPGAWQQWGQKNVGPFTGKTSRIVALSKVDYRTVLWVDGKEIISSTDEQYNDGYAQASNLMKIRRNHTRDTKRYDWYTHPAIEISAKGKPLTLEHIKLKRDVYYTTPRIVITKEGRHRTGWENNPHYRYSRKKFESDNKSEKKWPFDEGYIAWGTFGNPIKLRKYPDVSSPDLDEFFCLGDNSPQSLDGRSWLAAAPTLRLYDKDKNPQYQLGTVPRYNIIGRALLVFWPSGFRLPIVNWAIVPNTGRMRLIR